MKTTANEAVNMQAVAGASHEVLAWLQTEVDQAIAHANARAEAEARQHAAARKAAQGAHPTRVRFAYD